MLPEDKELVDLVPPLYVSISGLIFTIVVVVSYLVLI